MTRAPLAGFLAQNPFPHPLTDGLFYREKMRAIHRVAPPSLETAAGVTRVLEVGGGRSGLAAMLYPGSAVTTLDMDASLREGLTLRPGCSFVCGDACNLPFPDASFDLVTLLDVLEHIPDDDRAAREAMRVLKPGGTLLVSTPNADWRYPYHGFMKPIAPPEAALMSEWGHVRRGYTRQGLEALFGKPPQASATFVNARTALYHDVAFSRLGRLSRLAFYGLAAPIAALGYLAHRHDTPGTETAFAWRAE